MLPDQALSRHGRFGLWISKIAHSGNQILPQLQEPTNPLVQFNEPCCMLDLRATDYAAVMGLLQLPDLQGIVGRFPV